MVFIVMAIILIFVLIIPIAIILTCILPIHRILAFSAAGTVHMLRILTIAVVIVLLTCLCQHVQQWAMVHTCNKGST